MRTETYVLLLHEMPRSSNVQAANRFVISKEKKAWDGKFLMALMVAKMRQGATHVNASTTVRWKHKRGRDWHNYFAGVVKSLADALVTGGYLPDDTGDYFHMETPFVFEYPSEWADGLHKVELVIKLEATYE